MRDYAVVHRTLLQDLYGDSSPPEAMPFGDSIESVRRYMLSQSFFKKLAPSGEPSAQQIEKASLKFKEVNQSLAEDFVWVSENEAESCFFDYFRNHLNNALLSDDPVRGFGIGDLAKYMTTGPGASQQADSRSWYTKVFQSPLSYTDEYLIPIYRAALCETSSWAEAELLRFHDYGFTRVEGGKLFFVLKNVDEARTCCTEPGLNGIVQQGIRGFLERRLVEYFNINVETQPAVNRELAQQGSVDGSFGTIDLTSASDSNSLSLFRKHVYSSFLKGLILASRCEVAVLPNGDIERLRMVSTMGNAYTFPLMTILLASAAQACLDLMDPGARFSVFGDDIVVPTRCYSFLIRMLEKLGYQPNRRKSFGVGPFRESCGHDYYNGHFVRGVYVKSLETPAYVYSAFNRLTRWSAYTGISLTGTLRLLRSMARDMRVPYSEDDLSGFKVPFCVTTPRVDASYWFKYRCLKRRTRFLRVEEDGEDGLDISYLVSILAGVHKHAWMRDNLTGESTIGPLGSFLRDPPGAPPRMKIASRSIPYWDYVNPDSEPGNAWLPDQPPKKLTKYDMDPIRLRIRDDFHLWERVVVAAV